jgi:hypothetical protein
MGYNSPGRVKLIPSRARAVKGNMTENIFALHATLMFNPGHLKFVPRSDLIELVSHVRADNEPVLLECALDALLLSVRYEPCLELRSQLHDLELPERLMAVYHESPNMLIASILEYLILDDIADGTTLFTVALTSVVPPTAENIYEGERHRAYIRLLAMVAQRYRNLYTDALQSIAAFLPLQ